MICTPQHQILLNVLLEQMVVDCDLEMGGAVQMMGIVRILLDPESMLNNKYAERAEFLAFFYKQCMHNLTGEEGEAFVFAFGNK